MSVKVYNESPRGYEYHSNLLVEVANELLQPEGKTFDIGENGEILRFLLYYFNGLPDAEYIFPDKGYKTHKNLLLCGKVGVGKTFLMRVFEEYLRRTKNRDRSFFNLSVTQMVNYYKINNHLDRYTYNEEGAKTFEGNPVNVCLHDIGLKTHLHFGTDTKVLVEDFLHARTEIWEHRQKFTHLTTNLTPVQLAEYFNDEHGRLVDRFKFYNIIHLKGDSKR